MHAFEVPSSFVSYRIQTMHTASSGNLCCTRERSARGTPMDEITLKDSLYAIQDEKKKKKRRGSITIRVTQFALLNFRIVVPSMLQGSVAATIINRRVRFNFSTFSILKVLNSIPPFFFFFFFPTTFIATINISLRNQLITPKIERI